MFDRAQVEKFLRMNGVPPTASDEEIKSVLLHASWHEEDVQTAILVLRENNTSHVSHVDSVHTIFKSDGKLNSNGISKLLGIDVDLSSSPLDSKGKRKKKNTHIVQTIEIAFLSVLLAGMVVVGSMWYLEIGIFHFASV